MTDQNLEMQVLQCVKSCAHKPAGQIYRELRARFYHIKPKVIAGILSKIIELEVENKCD